MADNAASGIWTTDAINSMLYDRVEDTLSRLEAIDRDNSESAHRIAQKRQAVLKELVHLADSLGCDEAAAHGREGYNIYFGGSL